MHSLFQIDDGDDDDDVFDLFTFSLSASLVPFVD